MEEAFECDGGGPSVVPQRDRLHRRDVREGREAHVCPWSQPPRLIAPLQFQLGRKHAKGDRYPRRGGGRCQGIQGTREGSGGSEHLDRGAINSPEFINVVKVSAGSFIDIDFFANPPSQLLSTELRPACLFVFWHVVRILRTLLPPNNIYGN